MLWHAPAKTVIALACALVANAGRGARLIASELVLHHPSAIASLSARDVRRLAGRLASWDDVDIFACAVSGQAYREGRIGDAELARWARSPDRWWRRAALVSTIPLNVKAQGGEGDARRTLRVCRLLVADRDDMVVKALSWALRALAERDPAAVKRFVAAERARLAPRVLREVGNKLRTGLKNPRGRTRAAR
jgi:3-methyladenine DNA glycosylase AlkD